MKYKIKICNGFTNHKMGWVRIDFQYYNCMQVSSLKGITVKI